MKHYQVFVADFQPQLFSALFIITAIFLALTVSSAGPALWQANAKVLASHFTAIDGLQAQTLETQSRFKEAITAKTATIPFKTKVIIDYDLEFGTVKIITKGQPGQRKEQIKTISYDGKPYSTEVVETELIAAQDQIIAVGRKKLLRTLDTGSGSIQYFAKLRMFATSYDKNCRGCNETTATGMKAGFGVVAVDPQIIPLGTKIYVPGYGVAVAGDTGGAIKGDVIDLGFDDLKKGWWSARFTDVYLLE